MKKNTRAKSAAMAASLLALGAALGLVHRSAAGAAPDAQQAALAATPQASPTAPQTQRAQPSPTPTTSTLPKASRPAQTRTRAS
jgi:hypothetical protein